ncbi:MAG TPA: prolyl oligopeptidase family serine peptidase [Pirellulales bacterium]|jgi:predicted esterase|nr:prolyl oligopeptidase family serine peptidase [Pirellulales bacterium]
MKITLFALFMLLSLPLHADDNGWTPTKDASKDGTINGRAMETFESGVKPEWGYAAPQQDAFIVVHPKEERKNAPLYVVLHSAGHDVVSCLNCTRTIGNHDIYRSPDDYYALYVDCRKNMAQDWWWGGMHLKDAGLIKRNSGGNPMPVEKRVIDTVQWVIQNYEIDPNRVYLSGNSMGGSGTLGIGMRHGDVFAAIKANVPAGIEHVSDRMYFPPQAVPDNVKLPDPPVAIDYSAPNDHWSEGHERFIQAMNDRKYALYCYWGPFGHANNSAEIMKVNDLIDSLDWLNIKKNEAYPVFTNATSNSKLPWPDDLKSTAAGQVNAFFRWKNVSDSAEKVELSLYLVSAAQLKTRFEIPQEASADVTLRRLQSFQLKPGDTFRWTFGTAQGEGKADVNGLITIPALKMTAEPATLTVTR